MIERRNRLRLPLEAFAELSREDFDHDVALQPGIVFGPYEILAPIGTRR